MYKNGDNKGRGGAFRKAYCVKCRLEHNLANLVKHRCFDYPITTPRIAKIANYFITKRRMLDVKPRYDIQGNRIEWHITPEQMITLFDEARVDPEQLGAKKGGVNLCRYEDIGHYEIGNVYFDLHENNMAEQKTNKRKHGISVKWANQFTKDDAKVVTNM